MRSAAGATLIELVVTIVILGILGAVASIYLQPALEAYFAAQRRAVLVDVADTALRRVVRDLRLALPNSVRIDGTGRFAEILLTKNGGRYRSAHDTDPATADDVLDFSAPDTGFDTLGALATGAGQTVQANDYVVIHNLGITGANAYDTGAARPNIATIAAFGAGALPNEDHITLAGAGNQFPLESPGRRFFVVSGPVTFACVNPGVSGGEGTGTLQRWSGYAPSLNGGSPPTSLPAGATDALLAKYVSACSLAYTALPLQSRGLVAIRLELTHGGETARLYFEAHVNNVP